MCVDGVIAVVGADQVCTAVAVDVVISRTCGDGVCAGTCAHADAGRVDRVSVDGEVASSGACTDVRLEVVHRHVGCANQSHAVVVQRVVGIDRDGIARIDTVDGDVAS